MAVVSIRKDYPGHARKIMMGVWSYLRQFSYTKFVVVVDAGVNVRCWTDIIWNISTNVEPSRDVEIIDNTPIDYLDFASVDSRLGSKMGIDATTKIFPETKREWGKKIVQSPDIMQEVDLLMQKLNIK